MDAGSSAKSVMRAEATDRPVLSRRKRLLYGAIVALVSTGLFLGGLELVLRLAGAGYAPGFHRVARMADGSRRIRENRDFTLTYFPAALVRRPPAFRLPVAKRAKSYRIFVLGSSAAMGDPEASFSLARMLEVMLRNAYPDIEFEVVNAAITAINSHVVRAIASDCAELAPDLFIVYEGHNEVIGPFGPAAVLTRFSRSRAVIAATVALRHTRTGQCLAALAQRNAPADWGGMGMFLDQAITRDDPRLATVRTHFRHNLEAIAAAAQGAGAHTLLCTVLTNQRDFAPFLSGHRAGLLPDQLAAWRNHFAAGNTAMAAGRAEEAEASFRAALAIDDQHAELAFRLGRLCLAQGRTAEARDLLQRALDLDQLRFRTDSALNQTIRDVAAYENEAVELVDLAAELAAIAPHGIVGDEFLYEHVHLTFRGTWEVARRLLDRVSADLMRRGRIRAAVDEPLAQEAARVQLGYTIYEQAMIAQELLHRFAAPPFSGQSDQPFRIGAWQQRAATAAGLLNQPGARTTLAAAYEQALATAPDDWVLRRNYGMALVAQGDPTAALPWLEQARAWIDDDPDTLFALATALRATQRDDEAATVLARLRELEPRYPGLPAAE